MIIGLNTTSLDEGILCCRCKQILFPDINIAIHEGCKNVTFADKCLIVSKLPFTLINYIK